MLRSTGADTRTVLLPILQLQSVESQSHVAQPRVPQEAHESITSERPAGAEVALADQEGLHPPIPST